jgi:hypothetical protein
MVVYPLNKKKTHYDKRLIHRVCGVNWAFTDKGIKNMYEYIIQNYLNLPEKILSPFIILGKSNDY